MALTHDAMCLTPSFVINDFGGQSLTQFIDLLYFIRYYEN